MLTFFPSRDESTVAVKFTGTATREDAEKIERYVSDYFGEKREFNIFAVMDDVDGTTLMGLAYGMKFDAKRWSQFRKFAVVTELKWLEAVTELGKFLPGLEAKHFAKGEEESAWAWIKE
ncbi:STAS/SEC14 domain-containing protein [Neobacillus notoginsengisoli]|uniref:STAS/SEC14 domain-containing protein n=1 Tax=Neobacillus notoginsengisoli TaxID=1578198 RepID=A0A417YRL1_9BACI|nr:STAS/SEC14 domain-containing protein [Neobacillus notoginsengisoli]RHW37377.1 STAS/SEC14 domain-containing protein [Neobacillus notoginsengisoli]